jgi:hypothetical protein
MMSVVSACATEAAKSIPKTIIASAIERLAIQFSSV